MEEEWDEKYGDGKEQAAEATVTHQRKFSMVEDAYNRAVPGLRGPKSDIVLSSVGAIEQKKIG